MKVSALITAAALACGVATAASATSADTGNKSSAAPSSAQTEPQGEGFAVKTKRAFKRMADKLRSIGNKDTQQATTGNDTRTMGAGADRQDSASRARTDSAYGNSKDKQK